MTSLLNKTIQTYIWLGALLYAILFVYWEDSFCWYNALNLFAFSSYAFIIRICANKPDEYFTTSKLVIIVFVYSFIFVGLYLVMSDYYTGNTFLFSEADAKAYDRITNKLLDITFHDWFHYLVDYGWLYDDWGAPITMGLVKTIYPSKLFLNFVYMIMNTISALCLFNIGRMMMSLRYSFLASLSYSISSYSLFFMGCHLKEEILVFILIVSFYFFYQYRSSSRKSLLVLSCLASLTILFFRTPVALFLWVAFAIHFFSGTNSNVVRSFFVLLGLSVFSITFSLLQYSAEKYANGGDVTTSYMYVTTSLFQKMTLYAGSLFGPFPQLLQVSESFTYKPMYGAGLFLKFLLSFQFWKGLIHAIRSRSAEIYPLYVFTLLEMVGLSIALDGLELRKAMPHVPLFILATFWYMDQFDASSENIQHTPYYVWTKRGFSISALFVFVATFVWNTLK